MDRTEFKRSGAQPSMRKQNAVKRLALTLSAIFALSLLTACGTTRATVTDGLRGSRVAEQKARCAGWRKLNFSAKGDTAPTVDGVRVHNRTGINKKCWK